MTPAPALLDRLSRSRLMPRWAGASVGFGERRSKSKGPGMEFADHRAYQPGDDLRHLDPHLFARLGESHVRQYEVHRQLPVAVILDHSRSMGPEDGPRHAFARELAGVLGFVALAGGDQLRFAFTRRDGLEWSPRYHGLTRAGEALAWLGRPRPPGGGFAGCLAAIGRDMPERGLVIVVSDWWDEAGRDLGLLAAAGQEIWAVHVPTREELDPGLLGEGPLRLADAESGREIDLDLDRDAIERFRRGFESWRDELRTRCEALRGRYLMVPAGASLETLFLTDWRRLGLVA